jgi:hypothetical protein
MVNHFRPGALSRRSDISASKLEVEKIKPLARYFNLFGRGGEGKVVVPDGLDNYTNDLAPCKVTGKPYLGQARSLGPDRNLITKLRALRVKGRESGPLFNVREQFAHGLSED